MDNPPDPSTSYGIKPWVAVLIALIGALGSAFAGYATAVRLHDQEPTQPTPPSSVVVSGSGIAAEDPKLEIRPPGGPVDQCAYISGKGTAPPNSAIWLAEHAVGDQLYYGLTPVDEDSSSEWHANIDLGPTGTTFEIFAFVLGAEATALIKNLDVDGDGVPYFKNVSGRKVSIRVTKKPGRDSPC